MHRSHGSFSPKTQSAVCLTRHLSGTVEVVFPSEFHPFPPNGPEDPERGSHFRLIPFFVFPLRKKGIQHSATNSLACLPSIYIPPTTLQARSSLASSSFLLASFHSAGASSEARLLAAAAASGSYPLISHHISRRVYSTSPANSVQLLETSSGGHRGATLLNW